MARNIDQIKEDLVKIKKKMAADEKTIKDLQHKKGLESTIGTKKDSKDDETKIRELKMQIYDLKNLQQKVEKELKAAQAKSK